MPGAPDPLLGSTLANWAGAVLVAVGLVLGPLRYRQRWAPRRLAVASGVLAIVVGLSLWAIPRLVTGAFAQFTHSDLVGAAGLYAAGTAVLAVQVAGPIYAFLAHRLVSPLVVGVAATTLAVFLFFQLGGETESFALYAVLSPFALGAIVAVAVVELGVRRLIATNDGEG